MGLELLRDDSPGRTARVAPAPGDPSGAALRLAVREAVRLLVRRRCIVLCCALVGLAMFIMRPEAEALSRGSGIPVSTQLLLVSGLPVLELAILASPFLFGGSFAEDRRSGRVALVLARGQSRAGIVASKNLGIAIASAVVSAGMTTAIAITAAIQAPALRNPAAPMTSLFEGSLLAQTPLGWTALCAVLYALAMSAIGTASTLVAALNHGRMLSETIPILFVLALALILPAPLRWLDPYTRLGFLTTSSPWNTAPAALLYWVSVLGLLYASGTAAYALRKDDV